MRTRKRYWIVGAAIFSILLLVGLGLVQAWGPHGGFRGPFHSRFHGGGFHHGVQSKYLPEQILTVLDFKVGALDLSGNQKAAYGEIRSRLKARLSDAIGQHQGLHARLFEEMSRETPDVEAAVALVKQGMSDFRTFMTENLDLLLELYGILDESQQSQITDMLKEKFAHHQPPEQAPQG